MKQKTPHSVICLEAAYDETHGILSKLMLRTHAVRSTFVHAKRIRQQAWEDGVPGSNEGLVTPILAVEDSCNEMIKLMEDMKIFCQNLRRDEIQNWGNENE